MGISVQIEGKDRDKKEDIKEKEISLEAKRITTKIPKNLLKQTKKMETLSLS